MRMSLNHLVIEAKIVTQEDLENKTSIQFPDDANVLIDNMTAMIKILTTIVLRELEGGMYVRMQVNECIGTHTRTHTHTTTQHTHTRAHTHTYSTAQR